MSRSRTSRPGRRAASVVAVADLAATVTSTAVAAGLPATSTVATAATPVPHRIRPCHTRPCRPLRLPPITAATDAAAATLAPSRRPQPPSWSPLPQAQTAAWVRCVQSSVRACVVCPCVRACTCLCVLVRVRVCGVPCPSDPLPSRRALLLVCPPAVSAANAHAALLLLCGP